jgi:hypothetical protein
VFAFLREGWDGAWPVREEQQESFTYQCVATLVPRRAFMALFLFFILFFGTG